MLTDQKFFQGSLDDLVAVRNAVPVPVLRKDFLIDKYQVLEARVAGADCILLIAECLDDCRLRELYFYASELGMESLIEIYEPDNLDRVLKLSPALVGINNRNLRTFVTDLGHSIALRPRVPADCVLISESGEVLDSRLLQSLPGKGEWVDKANAACVDQAKRLVFDPARAADGKTRVRVWQGVGFFLD